MPLKNISKILLASAIASSLTGCSSAPTSAQKEKDFAKVKSYVEGKLSQSQATNKEPLDNHTEQDKQKALVKQTNTQATNNRSLIMSNRLEQSFTDENILAQQTNQANGRLGIAQLIDLTLSHPALLAKLQELEGAKSDIDYAKSQYLPTPSLQVHSLTSLSSTTSASNSNNAKTNTIAALEQPLWAGGRLDAQLDYAKAKSEVATLSIEEAKYQLSLKVISAYQQWMQSYFRIQANNKGLRLLNSYSASVSRRVAAGIAGESDRDLITSRIAQATADLRSAQASERMALSQLSQLAGQEIKRDDLSLSNDASTINARLSQFGIDDVIKSAQDTNPTLKRMTQDVSAQEFDVDVKKAARYPTLSLRAEHGRTDMVGYTYDDSRLMLNVSYAPGAGFGSGYLADSSKAKVESLKQALAAAQRDVSDQVARDYQDYQLSLSRKSDIAKSISASEQVLTSYDRLYDAGKKTWLEVLNAARELTQVETMAADVEAARIASAYRLSLYVNASNNTAK